jgi:hypothetical protein
MTSLLVNIIDDSKANDVMRFLEDIPFLQVIPQELNSKNIRYDFSDLAGQLKWHGDPVKVQREIRDEWE